MLVLSTARVRSGSLGFDPDLLILPFGYSLLAARSCSCETSSLSTFFFTGTLLWSILIDALNAPLQQVNANKALLLRLIFLGKH